VDPGGAPDLNRFVADNSLTLSWYFADERGPYSVATLRALDDGEAVVPPLWPYEVANGLLIGERRGRITPTDTTRILGLLAVLPIRIDTMGHERARQEVLELARRERLTSYDAAYLELAMREGLPLATLDRPLRDAAARVGVPEFQP
jgi:predicted nucleic acid-binding protein